MISVGFALWDAYDAYNVCSDYGGDSIKCTVAAGSVFVFSLAIEGDEIVSIFRHGDELVEVPGRVYSILKRLDIVEEIDQGLQKTRFVNERFAHIFDDIAKHGDDAAKALDDLVRAGVSTEAVEEAVKHGATVKAVKEGVERSEKALGRISRKVGDGYLLGQVGDYKVVIKKGDEDEGLINMLLRHVWGHEMEEAGITTFWPLGQRIVEPKTGRVVQLPKVFRDEKELREFLDDVVKRALKDPDYAGKFNGNSKVILTINLKKLGIRKEGIDVVEFVFLREGNSYCLKTVYPKAGSAVAKYVSTIGRWVG